jgi:hypothetical protein
MPEPTEFSFTLKEVATALIKAQDKHEGIWGVHVKFGFRAMMLGPSEEDVYPTAILPVMSLLLKREDRLTNISVNAAEVNPPSLPFTERAPKQIGAGTTARGGIAERKKGRK